MRKLYPKDFIGEVLIVEISDIVHKHPYLAFLLICSGIEFLGKCSDVKLKKWDCKYNNGEHFKKGLSFFPKWYRENKMKGFLLDQLRNGLVHLFTPKSGVDLISKNDKIFLKIHYKDNIILKSKRNRNYIVVEYLFFDFVEACKEVLKIKFSKRDKMNKQLLIV